MICSHTIFQNNHASVLLPGPVLATFSPTTLQPPREFQERFSFVILLTKRASSFEGFKHLGSEANPFCHFETTTRTGFCAADDVDAILAGYDDMSLNVYESETAAALLYLRGHARMPLVNI